MQDRAQALLLTNEQTALQQLDALLATSQTNLTAQRDRFAGLSSAIERKVGRDPRRAAACRLVAGANGAVGRRVGGQRVERPAHVLRAGEWRARARRRGRGVSRAGHPERSRDRDSGDGGWPNPDGIRQRAGGAQAVTYVQFAVRNGQVTIARRGRVEAAGSSDATCVANPHRARWPIATVASPRRAACDARSRRSVTRRERSSSTPFERRSARYRRPRLRPADASGRS